MLRINDDESWKPDLLHTGCKQGYLENFMQTLQSVAI